MEDLARTELLPPTSGRTVCPHSTFMTANIGNSHGRKHADRRSEKKSVNGLAAVRASVPPPLTPRGPNRAPRLRKIPIRKARQSRGRSPARTQEKQNLPSHGHGEPPHSRHRRGPGCRHPGPQRSVAPVPPGCPGRFPVRPRLPGSVVPGQRAWGHCCCESDPLREYRRPGPVHSRWRGRPAGEWRHRRYRFGRFLQAALFPGDGSVYPPGVPGPHGEYWCREP